ncbi:unnamed protein product [Calypogeia fissa]
MAAPTFSLGMSEIRNEAKDVVLNDDCDSTTLNDEFKRLVDELQSESDVIEEWLCPSQITVQVKGKEPFEFLEEDMAFQGSNPSAGVDQWAHNRLDKFRAFKKMDSSIPFDELSYVECSVLLTKLFEQV